MSDLEPQLEPLKITLYHSKLSLLSDKTFRQLLKSLSKLCYKIQQNEISMILKQFDLPLSQIQSISDRTMKKIKSGPVYHFDSYQKGSLTLLVIVSAFGYWVLDKTIGEAIKDSFKTAPLYKILKEKLSSPIRISEQIEILHHLLKYHEPPILGKRLKVEKIEYDELNKMIRIEVYTREEFSFEEYNAFLPQDIINKIGEHSSQSNITNEKNSGGNR